MIHYVECMVEIHGLDVATLEEIRARIDTAVRAAFPDRAFEDDIGVEVTEYAGAEEPKSE